MSEQDIRSAIQNTETFKNFPIFKQGIVLKRKNIERLFDLYGQASRLGLPYLKQNPNISVSEFNLISDLCDNQK